jgi:hypothetical protein
LSHLNADEEHPGSSQEDFVAGVLDDHDAVIAVMSELGQWALDTGSVHVFTGEQGAEEIARLGGGGLAGAANRFLANYVGGAKDLTDRHRDEARRGRHVVVIPLDEGLSAARANQILRSHGGHDIVGHFGGQYEAMSDVPADLSAEPHSTREDPAA